ncbi:chromate resistance protein ChrB domain-containing protein [uncultured Chitinophaga sp.]|uniref:chromate resistance protein ChrB domain-containing protein n=1 Tax=uncultured Chitinophaga sp. TaxID=339340 RepID=UPI0025D3570C|nr:chromate resistance protein ChrB domain-containing protein [uncultured Chitinophaga sp.]
MKWITREHPKIDRLACPWLIRRFIDPDAVFLYVPFDQVLALATEQDAIPYDIPGVELTHYGEECTFDCLIRKYELKDVAVHIMAPIVRGADTDRHDISPQAAGLWAISAGLAYNFGDDYELLEKGMLIYDALYSWAQHLQHEKHTQQPFENLLLEVFNRFLKEQKGKNARIPNWAKELKEMIQDHIDTNLTLKELSQNLDINPSYLSREFSKHFDNLSFGEYLRKQRIDKAIKLMAEHYSLTEISYLTGFSDQSHFSRIFKKHTGESPSDFRRKLKK